MNQNIKIDPYGFREYDARWLYEKDINSEGITNLGKGLGTQIKIHTQKNNPRIIVGHDYRSYSEEIKSALKKGLISTGCYIEDVGLDLSPMVYFAQFNLDADAVAMVTASHNENGWTGVKMGIKKGLTHAPEEMKELKDITLNQKFIKGKGNEKKIDGFQKVYKEDLNFLCYLDHESYMVLIYILVYYQEYFLIKYNAQPITCFYHNVFLGLAHNLHLKNQQHYQQLLLQNSA